MKALKLKTEELVYLYNMTLVKGVATSEMMPAEKELLDGTKKSLRTAMNSDDISETDDIRIVVLENEKKIAQDLIKTLVKQQEASTAMIQHIIDNFHNDSLYRTSAILEAKDFINNKLF